MKPLNIGGDINLVYAELEDGMVPVHAYKKCFASGHPGPIAMNLKWAAHSSTQVII